MAIPQARATTGTPPLYKRYAHTACLEYKAIYIGSQVHIDLLKRSDLDAVSTPITANFAALEFPTGF